MHGHLELNRLMKLATSLLRRIKYDLMDYTESKKIKKAGRGAKITRVMDKPHHTPLETEDLHQGSMDRYTELLVS